MTKTTMTMTTRKRIAAVHHRPLSVVVVIFIIVAIRGNNNNIYNIYNIYNNGHNDYNNVRRRRRRIDDSYSDDDETPTRLSRRI